MVYLPLPTPHIPRRAEACADSNDLPSISVITPSFNQARYLPQTLESILNQDFPNLETIVFDGGSRDGSVDILRAYQDRLTYWASESDRGPAHAINKGLARATGEILGWVNSDDMLATGALWEVARAFAEDPDLDMVYANAIYIDEENLPFLADHGAYRTAFYRGEMQPLKRIPAYWSYVHAVPQPTVFFRRRLLELCGPLNECYQYIFDFELFWRFARTARKIRKIERTQAFYRIHVASKTSDWNKFLVELYRFSRPYWPRLHRPQFRNTLRDFVSSYMRRRFGNRVHDAWFWGAASLVAVSAITRIGNPEAFRLRLPNPPIARPQPPRAPAAPAVIAELPAPDHQVDQSGLRYRSLFCSYHWPRYPGHSGGEIRDFHLLRQLLSISSVVFFAADAPVPDGRQDPLARFLKALYTPNSIRASRPDLIHPEAFNNSLRRRVVSRLTRMGVPLIGPRYHRDAAHKFPLMQAYCLAGIQEALAREAPDFLFVSPQTNPIALLLSNANTATRLILASYDVEAVRMRRIAASYRGLKRAALDLETIRATHFEHDNIALYDGVIAVSETDKQIFMRDYGLADERVLVIENGVDPHYFAFSERQPSERPHIVFVGSLSYTPNSQAAWRLLKQVMPLVWEHYPEAALWIVGQGADPALLAHNDRRRIFVTGKVDDVRPYLAAASVACVPLISGSGTKYKVLEALSAGVPMVCTGLAAEGLALEAGRHYLPGESDKDLAAAIMRMIADPALAATLARQGRELIERSYSWDANLARLDTWLEFLTSLPSMRQAQPTVPSAAQSTAGDIQPPNETVYNQILHTAVTNLEGSNNNV
jgi:glycosyltransferase involved in cell wall biosynthesis